MNYLPFVRATCLRTFRARESILENSSGHLTPQISLVENLCSRLVRDLSPTLATVCPSRKAHEMLAARNANNFNGSGHQAAHQLRRPPSNISFPNSYMWN